MANAYTERNKRPHNTRQNTDLHITQQKQLFTKQIDKNPNFIPFCVSRNTCEGEKHWFNQCPKLNATEKQEQWKKYLEFKTRKGKINRISEEVSKNTEICGFCIPLTLTNKFDLKGIDDSGAEVNVMPLNTYESLKLAVSRLPTEVVKEEPLEAKLMAANGT